MKSKEPCLSGVSIENAISFLKFDCFCINSPLIFFQVIINIKLNSILFEDVLYKRHFLDDMFHHTMASFILLMIKLEIRI